MVVGIVGSRNPGSLTEDDIIDRLPLNCAHIISGGSAGVDRLAAAAAKKLGIGCTELFPDYELYGKFAPLKRNICIIEKANMILAFWDMKSKGTRHVIAECLKRKKYIRIITI